MYAKIATVEKLETYKFHRGEVYMSFESSEEAKIVLVISFHLFF